MVNKYLYDLISNVRLKNEINRKVFLDCFHLAKLSIVDAEIHTNKGFKSSGTSKVNFISLCYF